MRASEPNLVDEELRAGMAFDVFEEKGGAAGGLTSHCARLDSRGGCPHAACGGVCALAHAIGDLGDFEDGVGFGLDALEFAGAVECGDPLAEVVEGQKDLLGLGRLII